jgi:hypothetical protein
MLLFLFKLPIFILMWVLMIAIKIPTTLLGVVMVPLLWRYRATYYDELPWWTTPWANPEDWTGGPKGVRGASLPQWWVDREGDGFSSFVKYHMVRNPSNGLRAIEFLDLDIDSKKVKYHSTSPVRNWYEPWDMRKQHKQKVAGYVAWQGFKMGCKLVILWSDTRHFVAKFGWRVEPKDAHKAVNPDGQRSKGAGFASKFLPFRKG